jgi:hypothetical protein
VRFLPVGFRIFGNKATVKPQPFGIELKNLSLTKIFAWNPILRKNLRLSINFRLLDNKNSRIFAFPKQKTEK